MAKDDAPPPKHPPRKRYQLQSEQRVPGLWLRLWLADPGLSDAERQRVQEEIDRRKALQPDRVIGVLVDQEDCTPPQLAAMREHILGLKPTAIHHIWAPRRVAGALRGVANLAGVPVTPHSDMREVITNSMILVVAPRAPEDLKGRSPAWEGVRLARHRKLPLTVVLPDGSVEGEAP